VTNESDVAEKYTAAMLVTKEPPSLRQRLLRNFRFLRNICFNKYCVFYKIPLTIPTFTTLYWEVLVSLPTLTFTPLPSWWYWQWEIKKYMGCLLQWVMKLGVQKHSLTICWCVTIL